MRWKIVVRTVAHMFSLLYGVTSIAIGSTYAFLPTRQVAGAIAAINLVLPIGVWGWLFIVAGVFILVTFSFKRGQHWAHLFSGCLWAAWTGIIIAATITGAVAAGAPFYVVTLLLGHFILAVHYRSKE